MKTIQNTIAFYEREKKTPKIFMDLPYTNEGYAAEVRGQIQQSRVYRSDQKINQNR
jgi:hypothetical protein